ncbi:hypothetical protein ISCGN_004605 [Ixodes scapularis]
MNAKSEEIYTLTLSGAPFSPVLPLVPSSLRGVGCRPCRPVRLADRSSPRGADIPSSPSWTRFCENGRRHIPKHKRTQEFTTQGTVKLWGGVPLASKHSSSRPTLANEKR